MTVVYFDSSAFVKLLVEEGGTDVVADLWDGCDAAVSSRLAYPEVCAALAAAARGHRLTADDANEALEQWQQLWAATRPVELTSAVSRRAGELAGVHALRGADAVHLSSALALDPAALLFAVFDRRLAEGARAVGLNAVPA